jgi:hypothetical protein
MAVNPVNSISVLPGSNTANTTAGGAPGSVAETLTSVATELQIQPSAFAIKSPLSTNVAQTPSLQNQLLLIDDICRYLKTCDRLLDGQNRALFDAMRALEKERRRLRGLGV